MAGERVPMGDEGFPSAGVLATIVLIRTLLSFTLELEPTGRRPWQSGSSAGGSLAAIAPRDGSAAAGPASPGADG